MRSWYRARDPLHFVTETLVPETWTIERTVDRIVADLRHGSSPQHFVESTRFLGGL